MDFPVLLLLVKAKKKNRLVIKRATFFINLMKRYKKVEYIISMKKVIKRGVVVGVGNGVVKADEKTIYHAEGLKVGLIK